MNQFDPYAAELRPDFVDVELPTSRTSDVPLRPGVLLDPAAEDAFGMTQCSSRAVATARRCILGNMLSLDPNQQWVFYSRDNNYYSQLGRYAPKFFRRNTISAAIESLSTDNLIDHQKVRPSPSAWYRSRFRPTDRFLDLSTGVSASSIVFQPPELIVLRSERGGPYDYEDCDFSRGMRAEVAAQNELISSVNVTVDHPFARYDERGFVRTGAARINPSKRAAYRVWNIAMFWGGRWYGPWWQSLPASIRKGIRLDGEPTIEEDFNCCHLRLLFALAGEDLGERDAYSEVGLPRSEVKLAIQVMLNASSVASTVRVLRAELEKVHGPNSSQRTQELMARVYESFPRLKSCWNTGCGLRLQSIDAHICTNVQKKLREAGIACLSIHDSFIVQTAKGNLLRSLMREELDAICGELRQYGFSKSSGKLLTNWGVDPLIT